MSSEPKKKNKQQSGTAPLTFIHIILVKSNTYDNFSIKILYVVTKIELLSSAWIIDGYENFEYKTKPDTSTYIAICCSNALQSKKLMIKCFNSTSALRGLCNLA